MLVASDAASLSTCKRSRPKVLPGPSERRRAWGRFDSRSLFSINSHSSYGMRALHTGLGSVELASKQKGKCCCNSTTSTTCAKQWRNVAVLSQRRWSRHNVTSDPEGHPNIQSPPPSLAPNPVALALSPNFATSLQHTIARDYPPFSLISGLQVAC